MQNRILSRYEPLNDDKEGQVENTQLDTSDASIFSSMTPPVDSETIATYLRVSTDEQSVEMQKMMVDRLLMTQGYSYDNCANFIDEGVSATKNADLDDRDAGSELMDLIRAGSITKLFIYRIDRIFRDNAAGGAFPAFCAKHGVELHSTDIAISLTSAEGKFQFALMVALAQRETDVLSERTQGGMTINRKSLKVCSHAIYGWNVCHTSDGEKTMRPNWQEQDVLDWINSTSKDGMAYAKIARQLNTWGVPTKTGSTWVSTGVRRMVVAPAKMHEELYQFTRPIRTSKPPFRALSQTQK
jgi:DNA invertase Pin-like site-specific DNA recombinase